MDELIQLQIEDLAYGGSGVGRRDGRVVFVPGTIPGETVEVRIVKEKKNFLTGCLSRILQASPQRIEPVCPFAHRPEEQGKSKSPVCPGCQYQHLEYQVELDFKAKQLRQFLGISEDLRSDVQVTRSPQSYHYRNKMLLHCRREGNDFALGYFQEDNQTVLDIPACPLVAEAVNAKLAELRATPGFSHTFQDGMKMTFRYTEADGVVCWRGKPGKNFSWLRENAGLGMMSVPWDGFFQINPGCTALLVEKVRDIVEKLKPKTIIDLYCGCGLFSVAAGQCGSSKVFGVDCSRESIKAAEYNARQYGLADCRFAAKSAEAALPKILPQVDLSETLLVVDPPRSGLSRNLCRQLAGISCRSLIYVSCSPDTLVRDLKTLQNGTWRLRRAELLDMFPRTMHFETLLFLEK